MLLSSVVTGYLGNVLDCGKVLTDMDQNKWTKVDQNIE